MFGYDPIDIQQKVHGKKYLPAKTKTTIPPPTRSRKTRTLARTISDLSASDDEDTSSKCRECDISRNGFRCSSKQIHIRCHTCGKLLPQRDDSSLNQHCALCSTTFCNLYYPPCIQSGAKLTLLKNRRNSVKIDAELLRGNKVEFENIKNYLLSRKQTSKDVFDFMVK